MAVDSSGDATFAWEARASDDNNLAEFTRVLDSDGTLGPRTRLSRAGYQSSDGPIAVTPAGLAVFEWTEYKAGVITLLARARSSGGDLLAPQVLDTFDAHQPLPFAGLALAPTAESVFGWSSDGVLHARTRAPGGALGPVKTIAPTVVRNADIGIDSQGNQVFTWEALDAAGKTRIFVRSADSGGTLSPTKVVSLAGYNAHSPQVAVTPAGAAAVTWYEGNAGFAVQATFGP